MANNVISLFSKKRRSEYEVEKRVLGTYLKEAGKIPEDGKAYIEDYEELDTGVPTFITGSHIYEVYDDEMTVKHVEYAILFMLSELDPDFLIKQIKPDLIPDDEQGIAIIEAIQMADDECFKLWELLLPPDHSVLRYEAIKRYGMKHFLAQEADVVTAVEMDNGKIYWIVEKAV